MKLHRIIFIIGLLLVINPFLGIPSDFKEIINIVLGILLVIIAIFIKYRRMNKINLSNNAIVNQTFVEAAPAQTVVGSESENLTDEPKI